MVHKQGKLMLIYTTKAGPYGTLLGWKLLSKKLQEWGFELNPYYSA